METRQRAQRQAEETSGGGGGGRQIPDLAERRREAQGCLQVISQHSYWFDVWIFLLFDLVLLIFIYLLP